MIKNGLLVLQQLSNREDFQQKLYGPSTESFSTSSTLGLTILVAVVLLVIGLFAYIGYAIKKKTKKKVGKEIPQFRCLYGPPTAFKNKNKDNKDI